MTLNWLESSKDLGWFWRDSWHNGSRSVLKYALALLGLASMAKLHRWMAWSARSTQLNSMLKQRGPPNKSSKQNPLNYRQDRGKSKKSGEGGGDASFCSRVFLTCKKDKSWCVRTCWKGMCRSWILKIRDVKSYNWKIERFSNFDPSLEYLKN